MADSHPSSPTKSECFHPSTLSPKDLHLIPPVTVCLSSAVLVSPSTVADKSLVTVCLSSAILASPSTAAEKFLGSDIFIFTYWCWITVTVCLGSAVLVSPSTVAEKPQGLTLEEGASRRPFSRELGGGTNSVSVNFQRDQRSGVRIKGISGSRKVLKSGYGKVFLYLKKIVDPQRPSGNWTFLILCMISITLDPLFFYIPVINDADD
ncbi:hypothetical protein Patl1_20951 [Pistacia atlantica]|uniref:Uncharacterized protein n=1 Tax=Pistacia atlantica TaxID=434234 RepID=A0ACC1BL14_9ROSI|nr:hypothetical protein Patl1_20951 [Pistacia atlantica]